MAIGAYLGIFTITCYDLTGITKDGDIAGPESLAVDPSVVPLGTRVYIPGVGERIADDTGGALIGYRLDLWEPTYGACANWGVQDRALYRVG
jgi:3D (Asp-Asp-Asp) domain-containing protein